MLKQPPKPADIMIIDEFPSIEEYRKGTVWESNAGRLLDEMLARAGIASSDCYFTWVWKHKLPGGRFKDLFSKFTPQSKIASKELLDAYDVVRSEIEIVKPKVILCLGDLPLMMLQDEWGIGKWRGSYLDFEGITVIPTYRPSKIMKVWRWKMYGQHDILKIPKALNGIKPKVTDFIPKPTFNQAIEELDRLLARCEEGSTLISVDIETRAKQISCIGFADSKTRAICIPLMTAEAPYSYWNTIEEELAIVMRIRKLLIHPNIRIIGQNFLYDMQYITKLWGIVCPPSIDTMIYHAVCYLGTEKGLHVLASLYCDYHVYWKDESGSWSPKLGEEQLWVYNCKDVVETYEIATALEQVVEQAGLEPQVKMIMEEIEPVFYMMMRGVAIDMKLRDSFISKLSASMKEIEVYLERITGYSSLAKTAGASNWWSSPTQQQKLFYEIYGQKVILKRGTGRPTCDDEALSKIAMREPLLQPIVSRLQDYRTLGIYLNTFVLAPLDTDKRMHCSYNPVGTETLRFNSAADGFGYGTNMQNIPANNSPKSGLPNIRELFRPDYGDVIVDVDLDRADLQVVVWEAEDEGLKERLRRGIDLHITNGLELLNLPCPPEDELIDGHPNYPEHLARYAVQRQGTKGFIHGTNYGGTARGMARTAGRTVHETDQMQKRWFSLHPGVKRWHMRTMESLETTRTVKNAFGFRRVYFDRIEGLLPEALAWQPQSVVAIVTNLGMKNIHHTLPEVKILIQVHDSLVLSYHELLDPEMRPKIRDAMEITVPYDDPLIIPTGMKLSKKNWASCKGVSWE